MIANIGLLAALGLLIYLALRGVNIVFASLLCSLVIVITTQLPIAESFSDCINCLVNSFRSTISFFNS